MESTLRAEHYISIISTVSASTISQRSTSVISTVSASSMLHDVIESSIRSHCKTLPLGAKKELKADHFWSDSSALQGQEHSISLVI